MAGLVFLLRAGVVGRTAGALVAAGQPRRGGRSSGEGAGLRSPCGLPPPGPLPGRKVLPMCLA